MAIGAAVKWAMTPASQAPVNADTSNGTGDDGDSISFEDAKKTLSENGLVPDDVLNNPDIVKNRTNEYGLFKNGKSRGVLSMDEVKAYEADGWIQIEGSASKGGTINIFKQATYAGHESHTGLFG